MSLEENGPHDYRDIQRTLYREVRRIVVHGRICGVCFENNQSLAGQKAVRLDSRGNRLAGIRRL